MLLSIIKLVALTFCALALVSAEISVPESIQADKDVAIHVKSNYTGRLQGLNHYRVYLATKYAWEAKDENAEPTLMCYLVNDTATAVTDLSIRIPASVGPDGSYYISTWGFSDGYIDGSGTEFSSKFNFVGGTSQLGKEEGIYWLVDSDNVPCSAYDCVRQCSEKYLPQVNNIFTNLTKSERLALEKKIYECSMACPGVTYIPWDQVLLQLGYDNGTDSTNATSSGIDYVTATVTTRTGTSTTVVTLFSVSNFRNSSATLSSSFAQLTGATTTSSVSRTVITTGSTPTSSKSASSRGYLLDTSLVLGGVLSFLGAMQI